MKKSTIALGILAATVAIGYPTYKAMFSTPVVTVDAAQQADKFASYAHPEHFISPVQLKALMDSQADVVVIGALNPLKPDAPISGSHTLWRNDYSAAKGEYDFDGMRNSSDDMAKMLGEFGATAQSTIVVYAAGSHHDAARLYWQIQGLGHQDVRYLDGGLNAWLGAGLPTGDEAEKISGVTYQAPNPAQEANTLATLEMVVAAQNNPDWVIIDTRGTEEFAGTTTVTGAFGPGTIPGSVHINWTEALNKDTTLKTAQELQAVYGDLVKGKKVIAFCQSGVRSAHTTMVLADILGAQEVYNYDGSWIEYSHAHYEQQHPEVVVLNGKS
ncbi:sulfurtransferase [Vibrio metoecus]|uniref:sulfurtransferase n=1 Tax=Vibrio metoecus TaxID=1481663 RepID=UPI0006D84741|nr:rhodanese-like domain-containing protein [Vibrio metoecus]KQA21032.1 thiosulfate sulfurtransferase [Vibrio metoecus]KQA28133.1 thiosulfate sulfurtransferase [Vibrio metoecus]PAR31270.1 sulfurtransferase [Vibrio metoecus]PAR39082.1 sulfurtransferase [Vibrio metoecus]PAR53022.1 sulfurtransferase [Vibrio metoecus]